MSKISTPHDLVFKKTMTDLTVAREFMQEWLPAKLQEKAKWETLQILPSEHIDSQLSRSMTDLLYSLEIDGQTSYLVILVEHQSTPDALMAFRTLEYQIKVWRDHIETERAKKIPDAEIKLPLIYAFVYYHGKQRPYPYSTNLRDCFANREWAEKFLFEPFHLIDLSQIPDETLKKSGQLLQCLTLIQKYILWKKDLTAILDDLIESGAFIGLVHHPGGIWWGLIKYIEECAEVEEPELFFEKLAKTVPEHGGEIMSVATKLMQKGAHEKAFLIAESLFKETGNLSLVKKVVPDLKAEEFEKLEKSVLLKEKDNI